MFINLDHIVRIVPTGREPSSQALIKLTDGDSVTTTERFDLLCSMIDGTSEDE